MRLEACQDARDEAEEDRAEGKIVGYYAND
jgi:hypothetical protein